MSYRIGFASDIHQLVPDRTLILSGVKIPYHLGEKAHSDGDVVYHAVAESLLGALALGDLGKHFPDNTDEFLNYDSSKIVARVMEMINEKGYEVNNIDVSITLEKPKLAPHIETMRTNLANLLNVSVDEVSVKAGTNEKLDALGRGEAVKAESIVLLKRK